MLQPRPMLELLNSQLSAKDQLSSDSTELFTREQIEKTPFWIIGDETNGYFLVMGKYRLTQGHKTPQEVKNHLQENMWDIILTMALVIYNDVKQHPING